MADPQDLASGLHPHTVFGVWAEPLLDGRRVALLGDVSTGLASRLAATSGRRVHAYDPNAQRLAMAIAQIGPGSGVGFGSIEEAFDSRDGSFDAVFVPDLTAFTDATALVKQAAALLGPRGVLVLGSPHESSGVSGPSYYELYDMISAELEAVHMMGVAPFVGFALADFAATEEPAVSVDTSLSVPEEPVHYLVVASREARAVEPYTLMQVPTVAGMMWLGGLVAAASEDSDSPPSSEAEPPESEAEPTPAIEDLRNEAAAAERARERAEKQAQDLEAQLAKRAARHAELESELDGIRNRLSKRTHDAERRAESATQRVDNAERKAADATKRATGLEREVEASRKEFERARLAIEEANQIDLDRMLDRIAEIETRDEESLSDEAPTQRVPNEPAPASVATARGLQSQIDELSTALEEARRERDTEQSRARNLDRDLKKARHEVSKVRDEAKDARDATKRAQDALEGAQDQAKRAKDDAERAQDQANRAKDEAKRAQDQAKKAKDEAKHAQDQANRAKDEANRAKDEANKARNEANRSREQANRSREQANKSREQARTAPSKPAPEPVEELAADLTRLEQRLKERGRIVAELSAQIRESRRVGRELLRDLMRARQQPPSDAPAASSESNSAEIESLRAKCARQQADLEAASWRIRALEEGRPGVEEPSDDVTKLEQALAASRDELAALRRRIEAGG
jgi:chromosome segregation ATPase